MENDKRKQAIIMRQKGASYNEIVKILDVSKGTLSYWFKNLEGSGQTKTDNINRAKSIWAKNITRYNKQRSEKARKNWANIQNITSKKIHQLTKNDLLLVGTALYWAEGYKRGNWSVVFSNADPQMHRIMIKFFREICAVPPNKLKGQVQIHRNVDGKKAIKYWSKITSIPVGQFIKCNKSVNKNSQNLRGNTLPFGTLRVRINDVHLLNQIKGLITGLIKSANIGA